MNQQFQGWEAVAERLRQAAEREEQLVQQKGENAPRLNRGQRASLRAIASRIVKNGVVIADEVGMGKTRIAVEVARSVMECGGRVAILVPPGLGYQWLTELRDGGVEDAPRILRSLRAYLAAWDDETESQQSWFEKQAVMVSHVFTNWKLGERTDPWRWALLPQLYACWREIKNGRLPRDYHGNEKLDDRSPRNAAMSISAAVPSYQKHPKNPIRRMLDLLMDVQWPRPLDPAEYSRDGEMRDWLERAVGIGLGVFDLVVLDEAHKNRGVESCLSSLLKNVIVPSNTARRIALTATPVELDVSQWKDILRRIGLDEAALIPVQQAVEQYADAVNRVRQLWRSNQEARDAYKNAAACFQEVLSPYILRRDKREDPDVQRFHNYSGLPINEYRRETEIIVESDDLPMPWRSAICAAESLSMVTRLADDPVAKKLRLTLGNGHGVAKLLDLIHRKDEDQKQEEDEANRKSEQTKEFSPTPDSKTQERVDWWLNVIEKTFTQGNESLYTHPAILAAIEAIEEATQQGEKVLVFGRFTRPLRALVDLLNAREMLRRVQNKKPWPQSKVHGDRDGEEENSDWPAVRAANLQLGRPLQLDTLDETLRIGYESERQRREQFRERLISRIEQGLEDYNPAAHIKAIFNAFKNSVATITEGEGAEFGPLALVSRALMELLGDADDEIFPSDYANAFCELISAVGDKDEMDHDWEIEDDRAVELWEKIESRLDEEYKGLRGGFARLMYGNTSLESRRMIQLAFNRPHSFPRVLVAQSLVGREGLNLHKSCRIVVLLHPEWNPGVVEQQIGRVDRVGSHWCNKLDEAIEKGIRGEQLPRIEVRPVIFRGTYDEHNWQVLQTRWDDLRAQLHGIVIPPSEAIENRESSALIDEISKDAPKFSPTSQNNWEKS